jgi:hypothetical protein
MSIYYFSFVMASKLLIGGRHQLLVCCFTEYVYLMNRKNISSKYYDVLYVIIGILEQIVGGVSCVSIFLGISPLRCD